MPTLSKELRRTLENVVADARRIGEAGAEQALKQLAVHHSESWPAMTTEEKALREKLRAHGKQLGDKREANRTQEIPRLKQACAYEHWHRMLFARFLAENNLLIHPDYSEPLSLEEVRELAREQNADWLAIASSFARRMLLEVFRPDDPVLDLNLPPEIRQKLEERLAALPTDIFTAEDSLGWVYQFWQRDEKDAVNKSEVKIGADELAAVTQLFTEDYMVLFLLHNTLGAWWTAKRNAEGKDAALPGYAWTYLRLNEDGTPAAGSYKDWPKHARDLKVLDPCMGSGHFLTFALPIVARMRVEEEGLTLRAAVVATLTDNVFGLELDARCSQIAAFNLALTAWRMIGQHFCLPALNVACTGLGINTIEAEWVGLAGEDGKGREEMKRLYSLFRDGPTLGSLIDPAQLQANVYSAGSDAVLHFLEQALQHEKSTDETKELAVAAQGVLGAFRILSGRYALVVTNVPYIGRGKQHQLLAQYCEEFHKDAKADLATCFIDRSLRFCSPGGSVGLVTPQNWLFSGNYKTFRERLLRDEQWGFLARLGPHAFETISGEVVQVTLVGLTHSSPSSGTKFFGLDVGELRSPSEKARQLESHVLSMASQDSQRSNPNSVVSLNDLGGVKRLSEYADTIEGLSTGDSPRFIFCFWEVDLTNPAWEPFQSSPPGGRHSGGLQFALRWENSVGELQKSEGARIQGHPAWGKQGVVVGRMNGLQTSLSLGAKHDKISVVLKPKRPSDLPGIWAYCSSSQYVADFKALFPRLDAATGSLNQVPFDLNHWQDVANKTYPSGIPIPFADDPAEWTFDGHIPSSKAPLQVAIARLVGYRWPRQVCSSLPELSVVADELAHHTDKDGIVCLSAVAGEAGAADRLRALLTETYGSKWSAAKLLEVIGGNQSLEEWLRDRFFEEHCEMFLHRPFVWHVWDGRKDGFHALVNYHRLAAPNGEGRRTLEKLIYTHLGDWITRQKAEVASGTDGADARRTAAQHLQVELERILRGEDPYDVFVRWKPLHEQSIGWEPDVNDGVRLNIRPWLRAELDEHLKPRKGACILRITPKVTYAKDKGRETPRDQTDFPWFADSTDRKNDIHLSLDEKRTARERRKK